MKVKIINKSSYTLPSYATEASAGLIGEVRHIRAFALMTGSEEEAIKEIRSRGLASEQDKITIVSINERFGMC